MDVGFRTTALLFETAANTLERIEQVEEETPPAFGLSFALGLGLVFSGALSSRISLWARFSRLDHDIACRRDDQSPGR